MVEFFIVSKCPMEGLYKNEKLARQVSASYQEAVIKRFEAPELAVHYGQGEGTGSR